MVSETLGDGVCRVVDGSPVIGTLKSLEAKGIHLVLCRTCLNYYNLIDQVKDSLVGGMTDFIEAQGRAI